MKTPTSPHGGFPARTFLSFLSLAVATWAVVALWLGPRTIRAAYLRESLAPINRMIRGQNIHPVEFYLGFWDRVVPWGTAALLGLAVLAAVTLHFEKRIRAGVRSLLRNGRTLSLGETVVLGASLGWVAGAAEGSLRWIDGLELPIGPPVEVLWMSPSAGLVSGAVMAVALWGLTGRRPLSFRVPFVVFAFVTFFSALEGSGLGLYGWATVLMALGAAVQSGRLLAKRTDQVIRVARRAVPAFVVATAALALALVGAESWDERRILGGLGEAREGAPNILLLILDTTRSWNLSVHGYERATTPALEALAESAVVFDRALATAPWTLPSHASMLTGHWAFETNADFDVALNGDHPTLAEHLGERGYVTGGFVGNLLMTGARSGLSRGFSRYLDDPVRLSTWAASYWLTERLQSLVVFLKADEAYFGRKTVEDVNDEFLTWLDGAEDRPFFAMLNYFDPHHPYESPAPFQTRFSQRRARYWLPWWGAGPSVPADIQEMVDAYDGAIAYTDHYIGQLLDELTARGSMENTILVVTSDHGEHMGERGLKMHSNSLYLPALQVPLIVRYPGRTPEGLRIPETVSIRDIPATVLDLAGQQEGASFPGASLARYWSAGQAEQTPVFTHLTYHTYIQSHEPVAEGELISVSRGPLRYIRNARGGEELYDVDRDPMEADNLVGRVEYADSLEFLRGLVEAALPRRLVLPTAGSDGS